MCPNIASAAVQLNETAPECTMSELSHGKLEWSNIAVSR